MIIDLNPSQMRWIRYLFNHDDYVDIPDLSKFAKEDQIALFNKMQDYIFEAIGIKLETIKEIINNI